jgi:hypothetical protein
VENVAGLYVRVVCSCTVVPICLTPRLVSDISRVLGFISIIPFPQHGRVCWLDRRVYWLDRRVYWLDRRVYWLHRRHW